MMMYMLLTGRLPFTGDSPAAIMKMHIEAAPAPPRRVAPAANIPASLEAVVLRALAKNPADRFPDGASLAAAVRAAAAEAEAEAVAIDESLEETPVSGRAPSPPRTLTQPLTPLVRRGPSRIGLLGLLLALASILAVAVSTLVGSDSAPPGAARRPAPTGVSTEDPAPEGDASRARDGSRDASPARDAPHSLADSPHALADSLTDAPRPAASHTRAISAPDGPG